jgi:uncharacterized protein
MTEPFAKPTRTLPEADVVWRPARNPADSNGRFPPLNPGVDTAIGVPCERDVAVTLRDGITIYVDVYRFDDGEVPAIVAWGFSGKRAGYAGASGGPRLEVPAGTCSQATMLEGPDPDYWCRHGYAVINVDPPGIGNSEGDNYYTGRAEGMDCADLIEWVGSQPWCNGKVGMAGNSYFAMVQLFTAAEQPPHLAAIAPWQARTDLYRQMACQGGIPEVSFMSNVRDRTIGLGLVQDLVETLHEHPFIDAVWQEKIVELDRITVPVYVTSSWSHFNLYGSIKVWRDVATEKKWLRVHRDFEWPDAYTPSHLDEQLRFFDRYLKGHHNGWEMTPRIRIDVMDAGEWDAEIKRPEREFPLARTEYTQLFLDSNGNALSLQPIAEESSVTYDATNGLCTFDFKFDERVEITGYLKLRLWLEAIGNDDADVFVTVQKLGVDETERPWLVLGRPHPGAWGRLRASHRELDEEQSTPDEPIHTHTSEQKLSPGEIVPLDILIWPTSRVWHEGESLRVRVAGNYIRDPEWFERFIFETRNEGAHVLHTGGKYDAHLLVPFIPRFPEVVPDLRNARSSFPPAAAPTTAMIESPTSDVVVHRQLSRPARANR